MDWYLLMHLGALSLTLPAAAAIAAWLWTTGTARAALCWLTAFCLAIGVVGASKIAFLGWGTGLPALAFKAVSGHATGATAVLPMLLFLLARELWPRARSLAFALGLVLGALVAIALVHAGEHTAAEATAGWLLGAIACLGTARAAPPCGPPRRTAVAAVLLIFLFGAVTMERVPVGGLMARAALALSGAAHLHRWDTCG